MTWPPALSFRMPPTRPALILPPNRSPSIVTAIDAMSVIGNSPSSSLPTSMRMPSTAPVNVSPGTAGMPAMLADRMIAKSAGSAWMSRHVMPISLMRIGSQLGHLNESPVAPPTLKKTPKPVLVSNEPSPMKAKLRASPPITRLPIFTSAPTERNETSALSGSPSETFTGIAFCPAFTEDA